MRRAGAPASKASAGLVLVHGRGSSAADMLGLGEALALPQVALLAPEAPGRSWWPTSFLAPSAEIAPWLDRGLAAVRNSIAALEEEGLARSAICLLGFSQGGCLALEFAAREGQGLSAVFCHSGALVGTGDDAGPPSEALYGFAPKRFDYPDHVDGLRIDMSCHERDPHIPLARFAQSTARLQELGADVTQRVYPGAGHSLRQEDVNALRGWLNRAAPQV
ncbi:alpha/beta hydrolase [Salipiger mangrovisoli]|uniref:Dienelactone hydrolase family protein n=1 Tax=Salipiger mangrovisoli TaxID=2865933 RepID=A0ABR9X4H8_9RHOB|nr:dienelactone hydrolase family protein [Salipiger mangrovisoli]MBE9638347.1 dienelactone hydrolase family protein [Salipiger mangrovisoli]